MTDPAGVRLDGVARRFGDAWAVRGVTLEAAPGELVTLLGPSGCGKTTTLRLVAGFETPDEGRVLVGGQDVTGLPPEKRHAAMVFQHYALFPNLTVEGNVAYGPRVQREPAGDVARTTQELLEVVGLPGLADRRPHELSGGQQQRVALARALAVRPRVLLLDEPLSNLDATLRRTTRGRVRAIQQERQVTTLWVTHDREEALAVSDRLVVLRDGRVEQMGSPRELCESPVSPFVAAFLLEANVLTPQAAGSVLGIFTDETVALRPDHATLEHDATGPLRLTAILYGPIRTELRAETTLEASGEVLELRVSVDSREVPDELALGMQVRARFREEQLLRFPERA